jgi:hypothetical protein
MCAAFNASITGYEPRKLFAIGLALERISQCSGSEVWNQQKQFYSEIRISPIVLWKGRSQANNVQFVRNQVRGRKLKVEQQANTLQGSKQPTVGNFPKANEASGSEHAKGNTLF